jgi:hypothetical protein
MKEDLMNKPTGSFRGTSFALLSALFIVLAWILEISLYHGLKLSWGEQGLVPLYCLDFLGIVCGGVSAFLINRYRSEMTAMDAFFYRFLIVLSVVGAIVNFGYSLFLVWAIQCASGPNGCIL